MALEEKDHQRVQSPQKPRKRRLWDSLLGFQKVHWRPRRYKNNGEGVYCVEKGIHWYINWEGCTVSAELEVDCALSVHFLGRKPYLLRNGLHARRRLGENLRVRIKVWSRRSSFLHCWNYQRTLILAWKWSDPQRLEARKRTIGRTRTLQTCWLWAVRAPS